SANTVAAHHDAATTNNAGYGTQILADSPVGYWNFDEPVYTPPDPTTLPVTVNAGTVGPLANGTNFPGITAGVDGPPFSGFGADNKAIQLSGVGGNVALGNPDGLNFDGLITIIAWIKPQFTDGLRDIVAHGYTVDPADAEVLLRINSGFYE